MWVRRLRQALSRWIRVGVDPRACARGTVVLLPRDGVRVACGIAALVEVADGSPPPHRTGAEVRHDVATCVGAGLAALLAAGDGTDGYAGGEQVLDRLTFWARGLKRSDVFPRLLAEEAFRAEAAGLAESLRAFAEAEEKLLQVRAAELAEAELETCSSRLLRVRDVAWHVEREALSMADEVRDLAGDAEPCSELVPALRRISAVLRTVDRIEIRGRDSAGLAVQVVFDDRAAFDAFRGGLPIDVAADFAARIGLVDLTATAVMVSEGEEGGVRPTVTLVYKVAAEVGRLGDNVAALRSQIRGDRLLRAALAAPRATSVLLGHTRWASSGVISVPNCHPIDNAAYGAGEELDGAGSHRTGRFYVVMNGDVDNHLELRSEYETETGRRVSPRITTDTKVVALELERHYAETGDVDEAWRRACGRFQGSCALGMLTDLAPGRLFLSLKGSGQSLYVGVSADGFFASSEVYGVVEETAEYVKLDGEKERTPGDPASRGQIVLVSDAGPRGEAGIARVAFDGTDLPVGSGDLRVAEITTRDVDRAGFEHYFRKEVTQAARSVDRTLWGRVAQGGGGAWTLSGTLLSDKVRALLGSGTLRQVQIVGQGTAAVAGSGIGAFFEAALASTGLSIEARPASELSGFHLRDDMSDALIVAVTQSGSTADTNRAVDLARKRGACVVAIVNRRNSDITYRADGVVYTSDGRDVEMSVASTKAFYSQMVAGALLGVAVANELGALGADAVSERLGELVALPGLMRRVLAGEDLIRQAAERLAPTRQHWAMVGSGPNRVAAHELRIKLSELCYKSIALDTVEDKKHIDLSSEPLVLVFAAGNPEPVLNDVVKDVAIFQAHKALPIVFAPEGETRFDPYAAAVIPLPAAPPLSSMVLCALAGHLFGYHAARAIDENALFLSGVRATLAEAMDDGAAREALPITLAPLRREYMERLIGERFTSALHPVTAVRVSQFFDHSTGVAVLGDDDLALLGVSGNDEIAGFVNALGDALDQCARPIDAIKHQAKIVTVGTSRPEEGLVGVLGDGLVAAGIDQESVSPVDLLSLRQIQPAVAEVEGYTRYQILDLRADGHPGSRTQIRVTARGGIAEKLRSRVDGGGPLAGTKRQVVGNRRLYFGVGRGDGRRIAILPVLGSDRHVAGLILFHLRFVDALDVAEKKRVLGARLERLRDLVAEADRVLDDASLEGLTPEQLVLDDDGDLAERLLRA